jgi:hypothetical protein
MRYFLMGKAPIQENHGATVVFGLRSIVAGELLAAVEKSILFRPQSLRENGIFGNW